MTSRIASNALANVRMLSLFHKSVEAVVLDLDGTLWTGDRVIEGAVAFWDRLVAKSVKVVLLSNTGERTRDDVRLKFERVLSRPIDATQVWTALENIAVFLDGLVRDDDTIVIHVIAPQRNTAWRKFFFSERAVEYDPFVHGVLSGERSCIAFLSDGKLDGDYQMTCGCVAASLARGARLFVTSDDDTITSLAPNRTGAVVKTPGPGVFARNVASLLKGETSTEARGRIRFFGKGTDPMMPLKALDILKEIGYDGPREMVHFVGDRLDADVRAAFQVGSTAVHVETGCHSPSRYRSFPDDVPHIAARNVKELVELFDIVSDVTTLRNHIRDRVFSATKSIRRGDMGHILRNTVGPFVKMPPRRIQSSPELAAMDSVHE